METVLAITVGLLIACAVYLLLRPNMIRFVFGLIVLSNAINMLIFVSGRLTRAHPALIPEGSETLAGTYANPLPQALILTAIVISFGLVSFTLVLFYASFRRLGTINFERFRAGESSVTHSDEPARGEPGPSYARSERSEPRPSEAEEGAPRAAREVTP